MKINAHKKLLGSLTVVAALLAGGMAVALPTVSNADDTQTVTSRSAQTFVPEVIYGTSKGAATIEVISRETNAVLGKSTPKPDGSWSFHVDGSLAVYFSATGKANADEVTVELLAVTGSWKGAAYLVDTANNKRIDPEKGKFTIGDTGERTYRAYNKDGRLIGSYTINLNRSTPATDVPAVEDEAGEVADVPVATETEDAGNDVVAGDEVTVSDDAEEDVTVTPGNEAVTAPAADDVTSAPAADASSVSAAPTQRPGERIRQWFVDLGENLRPILADWFENLVQTGLSFLTSWLTGLF
ncbi:MAG: hypothetical protein J6M18_00785 [Actinomycetaceae bacterium]|nr:hypothetical protein [Actinomycetaceae bacterium]